MLGQVAGVSPFLRQLHGELAPVPLPHQSRPQGQEPSVPAQRSRPLSTLQRSGPWVCHRQRAEQVSAHTEPPPEVTQLVHGVESCPPEVHIYPGLGMGLLWSWGLCRSWVGSRPNEWCLPETRTQRAGSHGTGRRRSDVTASRRMPAAPRSRGRQEGPSPGAPRVHPGWLTAGLGLPASRTGREQVQRFEPPFMAFVTEAPRHRATPAQRDPERRGPGGLQRPCRPGADPPPPRRPPQGPGARTFMRNTFFPLRMALSSKENSFSRITERLSLSPV